MRSTAPRVGRWMMSGLAALLGACEPPPPKSPVEVAVRVLDKPAWMADAELCPAEMMDREMRVNRIASMSCAGEAVPGCFEKCRRGDVDACYWLANALDVADVDDRATQALYQRACLLGEPSGCVNRAAGMLHYHPDDAQVQACTTQTFQKACDFQDSWGCTMLGTAYLKGLGVPADTKLAVDALGRSCGYAGSSVDEACQAALGLLEQIRGPQKPQVD